MKAILRKIRISSKKVNVIAGMVRKMKAVEARETLELTDKKAAKILLKVLNSAIANAEKNFKQKEDSLVIKEIIVTKGPSYKRSLPISRGRAHPILKRTAHITITVAAETEEEVTEPKKDEKSNQEAKVAESGKAEETPKKEEEATKPTS